MAKQEIQYKDGAHHLFPTAKFLKCAILRKFSGSTEKNGSEENDQKKKAYVCQGYN